MPDVRLSESTPLVEAASGAPRTRRFRARLIAGDVQGSSGFYASEMLRRCATVFREGLPVFMDHPSLSEAAERPERSVRDLAGRLASPAVYERDGLYADIEVYPHYAPVIEAVASDIGMSIRARGVCEPSNIEAIRGPLVTELTEALSVDFVTAAGAGGKITELLESARQATLADATDKPPASTELAEARNVGQWLESRLHLSFTQLADDMFGNGRLSREERIALSSGIGDALAAFTASVEASQPQLFKRDLWQDPDDAEVSEATKSPAGTPPVVEPKTDPGTEPANKKEGIVPDLNEAEAKVITDERDRALAEAAQYKATADQAAADKEAADLELSRFRAVEAARPIAATLLSESELPGASQARLLAAVTEAAVVPLTDTHKLDESAYRTKLAEAIKAEQNYVASLLEGAGQGKPRDLGESVQVDADVDIKATEASLVEAYRRRGMSASAAQLAASGRPF